MPPVTPEAIARKRERNRAWKKSHRNKPTRPENCVGEDERWLVLICESCFGLFDVEKGAGHRRRRICDECRLGS